METSKMFKLLNDVSMKRVGEYVEGFLKIEKGMETQGVYSNEGIIIQGRQIADSWKKVTGMDMATQVRIIPSGENILVSVGNAKWSDKLGAGAVGTIGIIFAAPIFMPLAATAGIGAIKQGKLPSEIFNKVETFIMSGGESALVNLNEVAVLKDNEEFCPICKAKNDKSDKFCTSCGESLSLTCSKCNTTMPLDTKFCSNCGEKMVIEDESK
ncbi:MAG: zinc ribbon domain-containing protein [Methanobrevibacter sp.]|jgi:RNA polymerase subunit RPABC4/transcription elongation factor Spt4|nr:zinc ribbon domain-containing protein [Methanobrevibacter sp.]